MAEIRQYVCDGCGVAKGATNHWYWMRKGEGLHIHRWDAEGEGIDDMSIDILHLCGRACVLKKVEEFMGQTK